MIGMLSVALEWWFLLLVGIMVGEQLKFHTLHGSRRFPRVPSCHFPFPGRFVNTAASKVRGDSKTEYMHVHHAHQL
jgi:hypothetical protein